LPAGFCQRAFSNKLLSSSFYQQAFINKLLSISFCQQDSLADSHLFRFPVLSTLVPKSSVLISTSCLLLRQSVNGSAKSGQVAGATVFVAPTCAATYYS
jgi:hypothetical protein